MGTPSLPPADWSPDRLAELKALGFTTVQVNIAWSFRLMDEILNLEDVVAVPNSPESRALPGEEHTRRRTLLTCSAAGRGPPASRPCSTSACPIRAVPASTTSRCLAASPTRPSPRTTRSRSPSSLPSSSTSMTSCRTPTTRTPGCAASSPGANGAWASPPRPDLQVPERDRRRLERSTTRRPHLVGAVELSAGQTYAAIPHAGSCDHRTRSAHGYDRRGDLHDGIRTDS